MHWASQGLRDFALAKVALGVARGFVAGSVTLQARAATWSCIRIQDVAKAATWPCRRVQDVARAVTWSCSKIQDVVRAVTWSCSRIWDVARAVTWPCSRIQDVARAVTWSCSRIWDVARAVAGARTLQRPDQCELQRSVALQGSLQRPGSATKLQTTRRPVRKH